MGIIAKQSIKNSLSTYSGFIIGGVYTVLLVPKIFEENPEEWGLVRLLISIAMLIVPWVQFSIPSSIIKFYPRFSKENLAKFVFAVFFWLFILIVFSLVAFFSLKDLIFGQNAKVILTENYLLIIPLFIGYILFEVFASFSRVHLRSLLPVFLREFIFRIYTLILILAYHYQYLSYDSFIQFYAFSYLFIFIIIYIDYSLSYKQKINIDFKFLFSKDMKVIYKYAFFLLLSTAAAMITLNIDNVMINSFLSISDIAVYSVWFYLATTLTVPLRSITGIAVPVISKCFSDNDMSTIETIYKKSSITPLVISILIFFVLWLNVDLIKLYFGDTFGKNEGILFFIAIGQLFNIAAGLNGPIIILSKFYKTDILLQILLVVFVIVTNIIFIPLFQIEGVAMATALSLILINVIRLIFVYIKLKIHPFSRKTIILSLFSIGLFILSLYIDPSPGILNNVIYTLIFSICYFLFIYLLKISEDFNSIIERIVFRKKEKLSK